MQNALNNKERIMLISQAGAGGIFQSGNTKPSNENTNTSENESQTSQPGSSGQVEGGNSASSTPAVENTSKAENQTQSGKQSDFVSGSSTTSPTSNNVAVDASETEATAADALALARKAAKNAQEKLLLSSLFDKKDAQAASSVVDLIASKSEDAPTKSTNSAAEAYQEF